MKKLPILLLSTLITGTLSAGLFSAKTQALEIDEEGITWYTVPELLAYKEEDDREEEDLCGTDLACLTALRADKLANNKKYGALAWLTYRQFAITSINLKNNTIKIIVFTEDAFRKSLKLPKRNTELKSLYIAWLSDARDIPASFDRDIDKYFNNEIPGAHPVYAHREETDGTGWFTEKDQEVEIAVPEGSDLKQDNLRLLHFKLRATYSQMSGYVGYSTCVQSSGGDLDVECVAMYSAEKGVRFVAVKDDNNEIDPIEDAPSEPNEPSEPVEPTEPDAPDTPDPDAHELDATEPNIPEPDVSAPDASVPEVSESTILEPNPPIAMLSPIAASVSTTETSVFPIKTWLIQATPAPVLPKAPSTGSMAIPCNARTIDFPWWLVIVIALGDAAVLWLFWPKNPKISRKTIDKSKKVR